MAGARRFYTTGVHLGASSTADHVKEPTNTARMKSSAKMLGVMPSAIRAFLGFDAFLAWPVGEIDEKISLRLPKHASIEAGMNGANIPLAVFFRPCPQTWIPLADAL